MNFELNDLQLDIKSAVRELCIRFDLEYWKKCDEEEKYPEEFVKAMSDAGWLGALIPEEYGGSNLGITEGALILQEINRSGGAGAACHAQMYTMGSILRHGREEQKKRYLPKIADGSVRLQAFGVTEPDAGSDTTKIKTVAKKTQDGYLINGQKIWTSRYQHSDMILLLARTTPIEEVSKKTEGMSLFLIDTRETGDAIEANLIDTMLNHETNVLFINDLEVPDSALVGEEGKGFRYLLSGLNAERILVASECIGDGKWFVEQSVQYANERVVFNRPIGKNQGVQFPIAKAHMSVESAQTMMLKAATKFDQGLQCGPEANIAKYLASEAAWEAADVAMTTFGGYGVAKEYHIERKWKETRLFRTAPISNNLVTSYVAEHILGLPRSY
ncbi:acyl-CoA dehydrogenase family protein [Lentibacillus jeotgali]|uniref:acyl-CoA dehydrogenase family protein n=1 Tax=Lentibacillus jeotgali TaxID=558169 RepID=UPI00026287CA|nr:acyl-CoA dehydrogenase family protein [Lentibacillus jeotgali]